MDVIKLAKFLNQISETDYHYDNLPKKVQSVYDKRASWIITFFIENGWSKTDEIDNSENT